MPKKEAPLQQLGDYLPEGSFEEVVSFLHHYKVHLTIAKERKSVLGDYRNRSNNQNHRISVNGTLNKYSFLITLLHELAHLVTYEKFSHKVSAHGAEWKNEYSKLLAQFLLKKIFPGDIQKALLKTIQNPAASSCADVKLLRVLHYYDTPKDGMVFVEKLPEGSFFKTKDGKIFRREQLIRKRIVCTEIATKKKYLFSPVYEVAEMKGNE